jgi:hypothetical protein
VNEDGDLEQEDQLYQYVIILQFHSDKTLFGSKVLAHRQSRRTEMSRERINHLGTGSASEESLQVRAYNRATHTVPSRRLAF